MQTHVREFLPSGLVCWMGYCVHSCTCMPAESATRLRPYLLEMSGQLLALNPEVQHGNPTLTLTALPSKLNHSAKAWAPDTCNTHLCTC